MTTETFIERLTVSRSERPEHIEVETNLFRVVREMPVHLVMRVRLPESPDRTMRQMQKDARDLAIAALQME